MTPPPAPAVAEMVERPILFSAPMVRALLAGTKTQTRRLIKPRGKHRPSLFDGSWSDSYVLDPGNQSWRDEEVRYRVVDRLWVRETWRAHCQFDGHKPSEIEVGEPVWYEADPDAPTPAGKIRVAIHMPRWASRITLDVAEVRVQRLQDISEEDATAEGMGEPSLRDLGGTLAQAAWSERQVFCRLWDHLHGPGAWDANPWVVALTFTVARTGGGDHG